MDAPLNTLIESKKRPLGDSSDSQMPGGTLCAKIPLSPTTRQRILFMAPLPPPMHGLSLAAQVLLDELRERHDVDVVDTAKQRPKGLVDRLKRFVDVGGFLSQVLRYRGRADAIYLTISQSFLGNMKDIAIYLLCFRQLDKMFIHLHGGAGMARILQGRSRLWAGINRFFIRRLRGVIVLGQTHHALFDGIADPAKMHIVPNFAEDHLFIDEADVEKKFRDRGPIKLLFLSNLIYGKGHEELLDAYLALDKPRRSKFVLNLAGGFKSEASKQEFLRRIEGHEDIVYHGIVHGQEKKRLFNESRVFCLPTYYPYEGQPISILEAYASGCAVMTTDHSGIGDVFSSPQNGYEVDKRSPASILKTLEEIADDPGELLSCAERNYHEAILKYRTTIYNESLLRIFESEPGVRQATVTQAEFKKYAA